MSWPTHFPIFFVEFVSTASALASAAGVLNLAAAFCRFSIFDATRSTSAGISFMYFHNTTDTVIHGSVGTRRRLGSSASHVAMVAAGVLCVCLNIPALFICSAHADESTHLSAADVQFFETRIRPVLVENCYRCHSTDGQTLRGGLGVDSREGLLAGGESGPAVVPGDPQHSMLWQAINHQDFQMPPDKKLPASVIADFRTWIEMGAPDPRIATVTVVSARVTAEDIERGRQFWAFRPPVKPPIPQPADATDWARSDIDRMILLTMLGQGLTPSADADPATLLRRIHFDLTGLPPSPEQSARFARACRRDMEAAVAEVVDSLLQLPQFGERWARHWLDVARYAESTGREVDQTFPHAWRYGDYVIDAFTSDMPYDRFIQEQIAGDLLPAATDEQWARQLIATGFLALGPKTLSEQNPRQFQADLIDEQIDVTTRVVMGISVACARCHDHKFDPIPQSDYYALAGIFQSTQTLYGGVRSQRNRQPANLIILPIDDPGPADQPLTREELADLKSQLDQARQDLAEARRSAFRPAVTGSDSATLRRSIASQFVLDQQVVTLTNRINSVDDSGRPLTFCMGTQPAERPRNVRILVRGELDQPAQEVDRGFVQVLSSDPVRIAADSSGRLELARWMTDRGHPLTSRVMVNRIWQHLLGAALVREPDNFGASGPGATHPELLDFLAVEFMDADWSVKSVIRLVMTSRTYRQASTWDRDRFESDPENLYLSRANVRRMDAEAIRDGMLAASGQLNLQRPRASMIAEAGAALLGPNGPVVPRAGVGMQRAGMSPSMPNFGQNSPGPFTARGAGAMAGSRQPAANRGMNFRGGPGFLFGNPLESPVSYRSVYLPIARNAPPRALDVFDFAEPSMVIAQRESSNTPAQALYLLNNPFVIGQADALAMRLFREHRSSDERVQKAFQLVYCRPATDDERAAAEKFLGSQDGTDGSRFVFERRRRDQQHAALSELCHALFASAEYQYVD